jgi:hypothetical protein
MLGMASARFTIFVFAATMGLAGFLLFQVQPVMAKYILPWFGGSATTWIVCMLFFQVALLLGYAYAYGVTSRFSVTTQARVQIALLFLVLFLLPITPADSSKPLDSTNPIGRIIFLLTVNAGVPYVALATTSPLLQRWLARIEPDIRVSRLFAVSNFGSFLGLLTYPFVFERLISSVEQTRLWSYAFFAYAILFSVCAAMTVGRAKEGAEEPVAAVAAGPADGTGSFLAWACYPALGSILLLATTNRITEWSAVVPFLWIAPLSVYLLTFVISFGHRKLYDRALYSIAFLALSTLTFCLAQPDSLGDLALQIGIQCAILFAGCMICHAETVRRQPEARRLPSFYLAIAVGGAIGGVIVALIAPLVFTDYWEHLVVIVAIGAVAYQLNLRTGAESRSWARPAVHAASGLFAIGLVFALYGEAEKGRNVVERVRNFYGVVKIVKTEDDDPAQVYLAMEQAGIEQGSQFLVPERRNVLTCAYNKLSGLSRALAYHRKRRDGTGGALRIGIIGLGAGMIAAYGKPGDYVRYYELNPAVADLANRHFTFLKDSEARIDVLLGDGRILLERESRGGQSQHFDILIIDAFRGASPPMHLLTQEAFEVYLRHLEPDGILAINSEFDIFEMAPLHRGLAAQVGLGVHWTRTPADDDCDDPADWVLYTRDQTFWAVPEVKTSIAAWSDGSTSQLLWTDSNSSLMSILNW